MNNDMFLTASHIVKRYAEHTALNDVSIQVPRGKVFGLLGPNGAGKTTLLQIMGTLYKPDSGTLQIAGQQVQSLSGNKLADFRCHHLGFVFQFLHVFGRTCKGIRGGFADYGLTDDPCDTFVGGQFFPAHIADGSSGSGHFDRLSRS